MADLKKVVEILEENKVEDKDIASFIVNLNNLLNSKIYTELISVVDGEKEMARLDKLPKDQMQEELIGIYKKRTGKDISVVSQEILDSFVTGFLTEYHKQKLEEKKDGQPPKEVT